MNTLSEEQRKIGDKKRTNLFILLSGIFITNVIVAELIGGKVFSLEKTLGLEPLQLSFLGGTHNFDLTVGVLIWPIVFITTDIINEYFGPKGVKKLSYMAIGLISYAFIFVYLATKTVPADFWIESFQKTNGESFNVNSAYAIIFTQGLAIIIGSLGAFLVGQVLDAYVFQYLRKKTGEKMVWLRATVSTLVSQLIDSFLVLFLAFYLLSNNPWPLSTLFAVALMNYAYKFIVAVILTPLLYIAHNIIDNYLGKEYAKSITEEVTQNNQ